MPMKKPTPKPTKKAASKFKGTPPKVVKVDPYIDPMTGKARTPKNFKYGKGTKYGCC